MKKFWSLISLSSLLAFLFLMACGSQQGTTLEENVEEENFSLDKMFGGYDTGDEAAAFGDSDMLEDNPEDLEVADAFSADPQVTQALNSDSFKAYFLRITWGLLEGDSSATEVIDWGGSAEVNKGTLLILKTIRFEGNDFIHLPRESRQKVEFTSQTKPHFDGLALAILDNDTTQADVEGTFTFIAGSYSKVLTFSELDSLELIEPVGSLGHEVSIVSRAKDITPFDGGFLAGQWIKTRPNGGVFRGRWINSLGTNAGYLRGIWGINRGNNKVFFGKYISLDGEFRGLLEGRWEFGRNDNTGFFRGRWVDRGHQTAGTLHGHFKTGHPGSGRGFFEGRYKVVERDGNPG